MTDNATLIEEFEGWLKGHDRLRGVPDFTPESFFREVAALLHRLQAEAVRLPVGSECVPVAKASVQVRYDGGALEELDTIGEALIFNGGEWDKVSWTVGIAERLILYRDGTWEHRTPGSLSEGGSNDEPLAGQ